MTHGHAPGKWISVDDRLPTETEWCLVYADGAMACRAYVPGQGWKDWQNCQTPGLSMDFITHWMHLPPPPDDQEATK